MIIDAHAHMGPGWMSLWDSEVTRADFVANMDRYGIDKSCVSYWSIYHDPHRGNDDIAEFVGQYPDRIIGFACIQPLWYKVAVQEVERAAGTLGFKGLKLHPAINRWHADSPLVNPVVEKAMELGLPMLFHCGSDEYSHPHLLQRLARRFPDATFIMGHMGEEAYVEAIEAARECQNIVLDTAGSMNYYHILNRAIDRVGMDRIVFGSDFPALNFGPELAKVRDVDLTNEQVRAIMGANMCRILGLAE